jgi:choice-of-anchor A domain-containing protein
VGNVVPRIVVSGHGSHLTTTTNYDYTAITGYTYQSQSYTYNTTTTNASTQTSSYTYVTDTGNYQMSSLGLSGRGEYLVRGDTVLYITGDLSMSGQSQITILPGASLTIYLAGNASLSGNGIMNLSQNAAQFTLNGLPTCTSLKLSGNAAFTGSIYAPNADITMNGGGNNTYDCVGAMTVKSATLTGHFNFHYDESLARTGGRVQYKVASWSEI